MDELRIGMIGLDTSHCPAFAQLLHDRAHPHHVPGARIAAAWPGGSSAFSLSHARVERFTQQMRNEYGVEILESIEAVAERVDAVFLESVDGRQHRAQFAALAPFGKPVFIDKPLATSVDDARAILDLARQHDAPVCSFSSIRFGEAVAALGAGQRAQGCVAFGPAELRDDFPGYFWYGIHAVEVLFSKMGTGCREVHVRAGEQADVLSGVWADGRLGAVYAHRIPRCGDFGCTVFTAGGAAQATNRGGPPDYACMLPAVLAFCRTRTSPVDLRETLEIVAFLEAANRSRATGAPQRLAMAGGGD